MKALPIPQPSNVADDLREAHEAIEYLVGLYFDRVAAPEIDREQLAECVYEGLSDEFARLYRIERQQPIPADTAPSKRRRNRITEEHLHLVAEVYRQADAKGEPPTRAVANHFDVSHSTAAKWVGHARKRALMDRWTAADNARMGAPS